MTIGHRTEDLFVPETSAIMPAVGMGILSFHEFSAGEWAFVGRKTPKNPYPVGSGDRDEWQRGYDWAMVEWFA